MTLTTEEFQDVKDVVFLGVRQGIVWVELNSFSVTFYRQFLQKSHNTLAAQLQSY